MDSSTVGGFRGIIVLEKSLERRMEGFQTDRSGKNVPDRGKRMCKAMGL